WWYRGQARPGGGQLFLTTLQGEVLQMDPSQGKVTKTYQVGSQVRFQPAIEGGRIYIGTQDAKWCASTRVMPSSRGGPAGAATQRIGACQSRRRANKANLPSRQLPWLPPLAVEPLVGFLIADETPLLGVPAQFAVVPVSQVTQVAHGHGASADLHIADRAFARANAIQPIALVAR